MEFIEDIYSKALSDKKDDSIKSTTINIEDIKEEPKTAIKLDFTDESIISKFMESESTKAEEPTETEKKQDTVESIKAEIFSEENDTSNMLSVEDYEDMAEFFIEMFDFGMSAGLQFIAKDKTDTPYTQGEKKKKRLAKMGAKVLIKLSPKFNIVGMFFFALIFSYIRPTRLAISNRKENKEKNKKIVNKTPINRPIVVRRAKIPDAEIVEMEKNKTYTVKTENKETPKEETRRPNRRRRTKLDVV